MGEPGTAPSLLSALDGTSESVLRLFGDAALLDNCFWKSQICHLIINSTTIHLPVIYGDRTSILQGGNRVQNGQRRMQKSSKTSDRHNHPVPDRPIPRNSLKVTAMRPMNPNAKQYELMTTIVLFWEGLGIQDLDCVVHCCLYLQTVFQNGIV